MIGFFISVMLVDVASSVCSTPLLPSAGPGGLPVLVVICKTALASFRLAPALVCVWHILSVSLVFP